MKKVYCFFLLLILNQTIYSQTCNANAGLDISICDGDGSNNNYTYLDGGLSTVNGQFLILLGMVQMMRLLFYPEKIDKNHDSNIQKI